ncbi:MurR/RpiR family transcriptional regulator [Brevibacillus ruminantium]|uniref:MurR/RpiR family transcriptional regulator n=1 Tax=Brevibacillus ruminantium TaxID=2950604 RepID=A0ABY4WQ64_9BACL|nr:MurR/RpiR family transcriptional regulator [Brevibacillus ruminantium]USG68288.1 MurR/RpiR family transcriptional regulator [Brevibacillus ruminantium]
MVTIREKIRTQYAQLTKQQKKVAEHLLENPELFVNQTASSVGERIGVSETTVIRFCYAMGYSGFSQLQREVFAEQLRNEKNAFTHHQETEERFKNKQHFFSEVVKENLRRIEGMLGLISETSFEKVLRKISKSKKVLSVGLRSSYAPAHWLAFSLRMLCEDAQVYNPNTDDIVQLSSKMDKQWVLIAFSFKRYSKETLDIVRIAKNRGVYIIAITDDVLAPVSQHADIVLQVPCTDSSTLDVTPPLFVLLHAIVAGMSVIDSEQVRQRILEYEHHFESYRTIMEE